jgi:hypothetical protein
VPQVRAKRRWSQSHRIRSEREALGKKEVRVGEGGRGGEDEGDDDEEAGGGEGVTCIASGGQYAPTLNGVGKIRIQFPRRAFSSSASIKLSFSSGVSPARKARSS